MPPAYEPRRLSYSALATFDECPAKFYARYVAGMRERRPETALGAVGVGSAVHELLEGIDLAAPAVPADLSALQPEATAEELERIEGFLASYCGSTLAARISALEGARKEASFSFEHDGVVLHGFIDVLFLGRTRSSSTSRRTRSRDPRRRRWPRRTTDSSGSSTPLRASAPAEEVEVAYQFLEQPEDPS